MKPWIVKTETPPGPWWRTVARELGARLSRFLRQLRPGDRAADEPLRSTPLSSIRGTQTASRTPMSATEAEALARALVEGGGLPEEWLARVQEGALPVEENGTPWYGVAPEAMEENSLQEGPPFPAPHLPQSQPTPSQFEHPRKSLAGLASDSATPWTSPEPVKRNESSAPLPAPRWSQRSKQGLQDVVRNLLGDGSRSKTQIVEKQGAKPETPTESVTSPPLGSVGESAPKTEHQSQRHSYEAPRQNRQDEASSSHRAEAAGFPSEAVRSLSQPPEVFRRIEPASTDVDIRLGGSWQPASEKIPASAPNPKMWPSFSDVAGNPAFPVQKSLPSDEVKFDTKKIPRAPASADPWALGSSPKPKSERSDLWPELPEEEPMQVVDGLQLLRRSERLRALDFEQRGGR